ncbi:MAG: hypothetical protein PVJ92_00825 [Candidatus Dependentiae bacterium]|jgi:hypothetical protein
MTVRYRFSLLILSLLSCLMLPLCAAPNSAQAQRFLPRTTDGHTLDHLHQQSYLQQKAQALRNERELYPVDKGRWDYWSMGLGAGVASITRNSANGKSEQDGTLDVRLGLERSVYLNPNWTVSVDLSLLTPAVRIGCVVDENTRVCLGLHYWLFRRINDQPDPFDQGNLAIHKPSSQDLRERFDFVNALFLSPSVSIDHFISRNCFVRGTFSYDRVLQYNKKGQLVKKWHWPQVLVTLNFQF